MRTQEEARPILRKVREARVETMDEVQDLNHKVAKARVLDSWVRQAAVKAAQAAAEADRDAWHGEQAVVKDHELLVEAHMLAAARRAREEEGARVLAAQLAERAFQREIDMEAKELEGAQLRRQAELQVKKEEAARRAAEAAGRKRREDLTAANHAAAVRRAEREAEEAEADAAALEFMIAKAAAEQERAAGVEAEKRERERVWKEMLAKQQRDIDRRGEEDERKARAAQEAVIYAARAREAEEKAKKEAFMQTVLKERALQLELKRAAQAEEAVREAALIQEAQERDAHATLAAMEAHAAKLAARTVHKVELKEQIVTREDDRRRAGETKYQQRLEIQREETRRARAIAEAHARKVEELRRELSLIHI